VVAARGDRHVVAAALLLVVSVLLFGLGRVGLLATDDPEAVRGIAGSLVPGLFTSLSIVLAIDQLVLSREFGSAAEIRSRLRKIRAFREDVEDAAETAPSPIRPTAFLEVVVHSVDDRAAALEVRNAPELDQETRTAVSEYAATVQSAVDRAERGIRSEAPGRIHAILPGLEYPDSWQLNEARPSARSTATRSPRRRSGRWTTSSTRRAVQRGADPLPDDLTQRVLARLPCLLLYVGVPALVAAIVLGLLETTPGSLHDRHRPVAVSALLTVGFSPLAVLFAYILHVAAVSERTIAVGPFVSRPGEAEAASETETADEAAAASETDTASETEREGETGASGPSNRDDGP
jgi:hypothetical protein